MIGLFGFALGGMLAEVNLPRTFRFEHLIFDAFSVPFFAAGILALLSLSATVIWLKEPQTPNASRKSIPLIKAFREIMRRRSFRILLYFSSLVQFAMSLFEGTFALHGKEVIGFGPTEMGLVLMVCGLVMAVAQGGEWFRGL
jgi:MFS transporter, DHA1 family, multidrug resistance protein